MSTGLSLGTTLAEAKMHGRKLLVPYITGGLGTDWLDVLEAVIAAGADAVEVGIPFSDPIMDGPIIQEASQRALDSGATPASILGGLAERSFGAPLAVMTYYNIVHHAGVERFAGWLDTAGVSGVILPDLPVEEMGEWKSCAAARNIETVLLVAPTTPDDRAQKLVDESQGFVYAVGVMGVTGERNALASSARTISRRLTSMTDKPVLIGIGISTPEQAKEASQDADGVVVGSALVRRLLEGGGPDGAFDFISAIRRAVDAL